MPETATRRRPDSTAENEIISIGGLYLEVEIVGQIDCLIPPPIWFSKNGRLDQSLFIWDQ